MSIKNFKIGKIDPKLKGAAYDAAVASALSPQSIASCDPHEEGEKKSEETIEHSSGRELGE